MWEFYLAGAEASFRYQGLMVFPIQLAHQQTAVPLTRNYILTEEWRLAQCERFGRGKQDLEADMTGKKAGRTPRGQ